MPTSIVENVDLATIRRDDRHLSGGEPGRRLSHQFHRVDLVPTRHVCIDREANTLGGKGRLRQRRTKNHGLLGRGILSLPENKPLSSIGVISFDLCHEAWVECFSDVDRCRLDGPFVRKLEPFRRPVLAPWGPRCLRIGVRRGVRLSSCLFG